MSEDPDATLLMTPRWRELLDAARETRTQQKRWFNGDKSTATLNAAKAAERRLDRAIAAIDQPRPAAAPAPVQAKLTF